MFTAIDRMHFLLIALHGHPTKVFYKTSVPHGKFSWLKRYLFSDFGWELPKFQVKQAGTEGNRGRLDKKLVHNNV